MEELSKTEILNYALNSGMLDLAYVQDKMIMQKKEEILGKHPYKIWKGKDGKWRTYLPDKEKGRLMKKRSTEESIQDLIVQYWDSNRQVITIEAVFREWLDQKMEYNEICQGTYDRYDIDFTKYIKNSILIKEEFMNINSDMLERFLKTCIVDNKLTAKGFSNVRTLINGIFKYGKKRGYTSISITSFFGDLDISNRMFKKVVRRDEEQVFQESEVYKITEYLRSNPTIENLAVLLQFETGVRIGELSTIKKSDIIDHRIHIQRTEIKYKDSDTRKTNTCIKEFPKSEAGDRYIILTENAIKTIESITALNPDGEYLFMKNNKRILSGSINKRVMNACRKIGIAVRSSHKIRKTYGTMLIDANVDDSLIINQMGHSDIKTTKEYYYYSNKSADKLKMQINRAIQI